MTLIMKSCDILLLTYTVISLALKLLLIHMRGTILMKMLKSLLISIRMKLFHLFLKPIVVSGISLALTKRLESLCAILTRRPQFLRKLLSKLKLMLKWVQNLCENVLQLRRRRILPKPVLMIMHLLIGSLKITNSKS